MIIDDHPRWQIETALVVAKESMLIRLMINQSGSVCVGCY
jgi:hypothetical protein